MKTKACRPYRSKTEGSRLLQMPDGKSAFKLYCVSIVGRDEPARYEWGAGPLKPDAVAAALIERRFEGVGFIIAFPHLLKVFRFSPAMETVLNVRAFRTGDLTPLDLAREDGDMEFACYAEAAIAADEYHSWARARTVEEYLATRSAFDDGPIRDHAKLAAYAAAP